MSEKLRKVLLAAAEYDDRHGPQKPHEARARMYVAIQRALAAPREQDARDYAAFMAGYDAADGDPTDEAPYNAWMAWREDRAAPGSPTDSEGEDG